MRISVFSKKCFFWGVCGACWLSFLGCMYERGDSEEDFPLKVSFMDVGQGLAVLLEYGGRYAMYDTGPDSVGVMDSLAARGVDTLDWILLSHNHRDHVGGFMELGTSAHVETEPRVHVRQLFVGPDTAGGFIRDSVLRLAARYGIPVDTVRRGASAMALPAQAQVAPDFEVLWPPDYVREGGNAASAVLRVEFGESSALFTGDLDSAGERRLLEHFPTLRAGLLQVGHHGSAGSSSLQFVSQVAPEYAVISVGRKNRYGHPAPAVVNKLGLVLGDSLRLYRTDRDGSVEIELYSDLGVVNPRSRFSTGNSNAPR